MLNLIAVFFVCSGIGIAAHIALDLARRPQPMKIMNAVWILTALWGSYFALWAYNKLGKSEPVKAGEVGMGMDMPSMKGMETDMTMKKIENPSLAVGNLIGFTLWSRLHIGRYCRRMVH